MVLTVRCCMWYRNIPRNPPCSPPQYLPVYDKLELTLHLLNSFSTIFFHWVRKTSLPFRLVTVTFLPRSVKWNNKLMINHREELSYNWPGRLYCLYFESQIWRLRKEWYLVSSYIMLPRKSISEVRLWNRIRVMKNIVTLGNIRPSKTNRNTRDHNLIRCLAGNLLTQESFK